MKKLLLTLAAAVMSLAASAEVVTFDFATETYGLTRETENSAPYINNGTVCKNGNVTITLNKAADKNGMRLWSDGLRFYKNSDASMSITANANITEIVMTTATGATFELGGVAAVGTYDDATKTWKGSAGVVQLNYTASQNKAVKTIKVTFGEGGGNTPVDPTPEGTKTIFSESFTASLGEFTIENTTLPSELTYVWTWGGANYGAKASAFLSGTSYASESWLISPEINLADFSKVVLEFEHVVNKYPDLEFAKANATLWAREGKGAWTQVTIPNYSDNTSWTFVESGEISLAAFEGKKIQLGFKYVSEDGKSGTWEVKNLTVKGEGAGQVVVPPTPELSTYTKVTTITSGKSYIFAVDGQIASALSETQSYGWLPLIDATFVDNTVKANEANAIVIENKGGNYTLKDSYGRYLGMDADHLTSFQIYKEYNEGCEWTIEPMDGVFGIVNVLNSEKGMYVVGVSKGKQGTYYTNVAPALYGEEMKLPSLYELSTSAVEEVEVDANAPVEFYNLQGIRVANPENGIFIRRQGNKVSKVLVK